MITFPNAKINIGLNVVEKRPDGYHNLETIFYPVKLSDALEVIEAETTSFSSSGIKIDAEPENNLVYKAYSLLTEDFNMPPIKMHLHKVIPFGAGLGGGSADAAFALKMLNDYFGLSLSIDQLKQYAARIGADCPFFINNKPTFAHGIGDQFKSVNIDLSRYEIVIIKPPFSVSTPQAYKNIVPAKPHFNLLEIAQLPIEDWKTVVKNDFEKSVFPQFPEVENLKNKLYEAGAVYASMSGSGSAVFGIFRHSPTDLDSFIPGGIFIYR
ncbi:4-(cytidine 5'-diphospho)-2-C-methyl-D-erythritol kinase [Draconibacterium halophilum]|uniref:4-diphosphocytidyl-2-C-methyl-D-erythritol kinase n=1 Tax=Draconibacterium halophilum TaxID=2706887 RepID=A0A6C0RA61_9BACT|nr:4-(cytidine 5'-diphospho)-2-C-methyl-D-erythritol kinase [Draconibacterium halophilum]QIA07280.1 4-(cytidine 5'-diphospho)-2-C-methyl-D-erythritol kinase [Draconibacterium halophilum]